jgi:glycosyltransferase involved in cell wall biosynthesis
MDVGNSEVEVLMATWNGARFLEEQLDSLFGQTFQNFRLIISDDGSTDSTLAIAERYRVRYPERVAIRRNPLRLGPCGNFSKLAQDSVAPYVAFSDQDDIWRKDKLAVSLETLKSAERKRDCDTPVLVFSDMTSVDEGGKTLAASWWKNAHVNPTRASLGTMLVQNMVTGCTMMANRSLVVRAGSIPNGAEMHDSWFGLVAAAFGVLCPITEAMVQYRQHEGNAWGSDKRSTSPSLLDRMRHKQKLLRSRVEGSRRQAELFARRYDSELSDQQKATLRAWSRSETLPAIVRQWTLHRRGLRGTTLHNHLGFLVRV